MRAYRARKRDEVNEWRRKNYAANPTPIRESNRAAHLRRMYGLSCKEYAALVEAQHGVCAICGQPETRTRDGVVQHLVVDHDHETGAVRGLLCAMCNLGLGYFRDDAKRLASAVQYLDIE